MTQDSMYPTLPRVEVLRPPSVAIIDDNRELTRAIARILRSKYSCVVRGYESVEDFLDVIDGQRAGGEKMEDDLDLILLDFHLPGKDGPRLVSELERRRSLLLERSQIMGITGDVQARVVNQFKDAGIEEILEKPLGKIDYGKIAEKAYHICAGMVSVRRPGPKIAKTYM